MKRLTVPALRVVCLGLSLALMAPVQESAAFGGAGNLGECTTFTTCTAGVSSSTAAFSQYTFTFIQGGYALPTNMAPGANPFSEFHAQETNAATRSTVGDFGVNGASDNPFLSSAAGRSKSDFGVNRASASTSVGVSGTDTRGTGVSAHVEVLTVAEGRSAWRDVWTFTANGHFNATIELDGHSSTNEVNTFFPSSFDYGIATTLGDWFYDFEVWDVTNMSPDDDGFPGPTLVAHLQDRTGNDEHRASFASTLTVDFDFTSGVSYVVIAVLGANARNGRDIDLYNTAKLTDVALSNGANLSALSGHDYLASPVPEPRSVALVASGLACLAFYRRRQRRR